MLQKFKYILFFLPFLLVLLVVVFLTSLSHHVRTVGRQTALPTPTPISLENPFGSTAEQTLPVVPYAAGSIQREESMFKNRQELSSSDSAAEKQILQQITPQDTLLMVTRTFKLEYLPTPNEFISEILTTDITSGKQDTISWLESQGLSMEGICHLPLFFYLSPDVMQQLKGSTTLFNPIPDGC